MLEQKISKRYYTDLQSD